MDATPRLSLPYIAPQQAQKQVTYNAAMRLLDLLVQPAVISRTLADPPASPGDGDTYIVAAGAGGAWSGQDCKLASWLEAGWSFVSPHPGWIAFVVDSDEIVVRDGAGWTQFVPSGGVASDRFGINATADTTNRLTVASAASLFTHDGAGHQAKINKATAGDTASLLFQNGFSGRAEFGLAGDDDFHVKVSADGADWREALLADAATGRVSLPQGQLGFPVVPNPSPDATTLDEYREGTFTPGLAFGGAATGIAYHADNGGRFTRIGRLVVATGTLALTSKGSASGDATLTGLPFAAADVPGHLQPAAVGFATLSGVTGAVLVMVLPDATTAVIGHTNGGAAASLTEANFGDGAVIRFTAAYEAAA